ncbi:MAG: hypothetical protein NTX53_20755 [candidate division WOR-3 bacterium]|nr:hypothetical protein [candidate division WOR-3 bacterium]
MSMKQELGSLVIGYCAGRVHASGSRTANRSILPHGIVHPNPCKVKRNEKWSCGPVVKWSSERNRHSGDADRISAGTTSITLTNHRREPRTCVYGSLSSWDEYQQRLEQEADRQRVCNVGHV